MIRRFLRWLFGVAYCECGGEQDRIVNNYAHEVWVCRRCEREQMIAKWRLGK